MRNLTIRQRIIFSFLAILVVLSAIVGVSYSWFRDTEHHATKVETEILPALSASRQLMVRWADSETLLRNFAGQNTAAGRKSAAEAVLANREAMKALGADFEKHINSDEDRRHYDTIIALSGAVYPLEDGIIARANASGAELNDAIGGDLHARYGNIRTVLQDTVADNQAEAVESTKQMVAIVRHAEVGMTTGFILAVGLASLFGFFLFRAVVGPLGELGRLVGVMRQGDFSDRLKLTRRDEFSTLSDGFNAMADELTQLIGQVQRSGIQVNTSITQLAATSKEQQATASEIAATTTEIGATSKEIAATSNELVRTMDEVSHVAEQTANLAGGGQAGLSRMEETMRQVMEAAGAINAKLAVLSEKAGNINQVVTTITKVADQTNLLSLNAAIEAEKAGQYGRGFAVVATEIRRLADQTAASTYDIEQMIKDIQSAVAGGVMGMDKFSEEVRRGMLEMQQVSGQLSEIIHQVQTLAPRFEIANEGMQAQAVGAGQISEALSQLSEAAQQTVESLRQSTQAVEDLNQVSSGMRSSISRFKLRA